MIILPRPLRTTEQVSEFLSNVIYGDGSLSKRSKDKLIQKITQAEMQQASIIDKDTMNDKSYRSPDYADDEKRRILISKIYGELIKNKRPDNDNKIKLGYGGALPQTSIICNKQAYIIIGLPASGKSGITEIISDSYGAIIADSDLAKRKLPEFKNDYGTSVVHKESTYINQNVITYAIANNINIAIPIIGNDPEKIIRLGTTLLDKGYENHLILVRLDRILATRRAADRFLKTARYVPLAMIFDEYANDPTISYYDLKNNINGNKKIFKSYTMISTNVEKGEKFKIIDKTANSPIINKE